MPLDPEVKAYLDQFTQNLSHRFALYEKELSQYRRALPAVGVAEHAAEAAETAVIGVSELRAMFANEQREVRTIFAEETRKLRDMFVEENAELRRQQRNTIVQQNNRTRLWVAAFGAAALIITGSYGLIDRWASADAREKTRTVCNDEIDKRFESRDEHDKRLIEETARRTVQLRNQEPDIIWGQRP